jgi:DNA-binding LytR/AlgR family response regulator
MVDALRRPIPPQLLAGGVAAAAILVAIYCLAYTSLVGRPETFGQSLAWAVSNICPWLVAVELAKRARDRAHAGAVLIAALVASVLLGYASGASEGAAAFELWRRVPSLLAAAAVVALLRSAVGRRRDGAMDIPLLPHQIDWVRAAGNYVELRAGGRTIVHRASISAVEQKLASHGFIRIHRSMVVRRDLIARMRRHDVVLADGTHLKVGKRFRAQLSA